MNDKRAETLLNQLAIAADAARSADNNVIVTDDSQRVRLDILDDLDGDILGRCINRHTVARDERDRLVVDEERLALVQIPVARAAIDDVGRHAHIVDHEDNVIGRLLNLDRETFQAIDGDGRYVALDALVGMDERVFARSQSASLSAADVECRCGADTVGIGQNQAIDSEDVVRGTVIGHIKLHNRAAVE